MRWTGSSRVILLALDVPHQRIAVNGNIRFELSASDRLPDGWRDGGIVAIGEARNLEDADALHLGHPLVQAAVTEARDATSDSIPVAWILDKTAPDELLAHKGKRGRLILVRIRYEGFERVDRLIPIALLEGEVSPLSSDSANWLLEHQPQDRPALAKGRNRERPGG